MGGRRQGRLKAGRGLLSTKHRTCYLRHRWPGPKFSRQWCPPPGERPSFGDFPWTSKESHPAAGRDRRSSAFNLPSDLEHRQNRRVASRQTPYFLSKRQQKVSKKCLRLAAGTPFATVQRDWRTMVRTNAAVLRGGETTALMLPVGSPSPDSSENPEPFHQIEQRRARWIERRPLLPLCDALPQLSVEKPQGSK
jgi:hypothetical protein